MPASSTIPTPATPDVVTTTILVEGSQIPGTYNVLSILVGKEVNHVPTATIVLADGEAAQQTFEVSNGVDFLPGKKLEIKAGYKAQESTIFKGIVVTHSLKIREWGSYLTVECKDESVKMTLDRKCQYYREQKDSEVMEDLIGKYGLQKDVQPTTLKHKELVQFETTDWDFLITRCEANGSFCIPDDGKVTIAKPEFGQTPKLSVGFGSSILELDVEMDARHQFKAVKSLAWNPADQALVTTDASEPTTAQHGNLNPDDVAKAVDVASFELRHSGNVSSPELQDWADARLMRQRLAMTFGRAKFQGFADIKPGMVLELNPLAERFEGKVWVSGVRHEIAEGNWLTDVQFGLSPAWHFEKYDLRPPSAGGLLPPVGGLQIGIVTKLENDPDGEDRIQLRLPLISPNDEGIWARVATLDAGNQRGSFFRPEIDDEVVVGFLDDDPRHPVVLGMLNSSAKPAPHQPKDDNHEKGFVTRSGMRCWFDDDKKIVSLETPGGNKLVMDEDDKSITLQDQHGNKLVLNQDGILIESVKDLVMKAAKDVKTEGVNVEAKASANFKAEGNAAATVKASTTATLEGGASAVVKGGVVQIN